ncbi:hypothetical protein [Streptomyces sp. NPDC005374]|uniref:hypothetical protein n=1 Tax=Streptomyces sp. NPDC005374 TaxID=3364713 RepID=UPI0036BA2A18
MVSTISCGRTGLPVAEDPVSAVMEEVKSAGTTSAPNSLPLPNSSFTSFSFPIFQSISPPLAVDALIDTVICTPRLTCLPPTLAPLV